MTNKQCCYGRGSPSFNFCTGCGACHIPTEAEIAERKRKEKERTEELFQEYAMAIMNYYKDDLIPKPIIDWGAAAAALKKRKETPCL